MFLELNHTKLDVFTIARKMVLLCYKETKNFPQEERYGMISQIRRAALSVYLNIAEGCSRKSERERKIFLEISRSSLVEVDAAFDVAVALNYHSKDQLSELGSLITRTFQLLSKMITS